MAKKNICLILDYYYFLGNKWSYPILFHMDEKKKYSFDEFIFISKRKISRSLLADFLKNAVKLSILNKDKGKYSLTNLGMKLKNEFLVIRDILISENKCSNDICCSKSLVAKQRVISVNSKKN